MEQKFKIPNLISPPPLARLARIVQLDNGMSALEGRELPQARIGEILNVTNATPDGELLYCVACDGQDNQSNEHRVREGWLPSQAVDELETSEAEALPCEVRLRGSELYKRLTFVYASEDWQDVGDDPCTLELMEGDVLQLSGLEDGWAYGWTLEQPSKTGWFPMSTVQRLEPTLASLGHTIEQPLTPLAAEDDIRLLMSKPFPPPHDFEWEGELPALVAESMERMESEWQNVFARIDADLAAKMEASVAAEASGHENEGGAAPPVGAGTGQSERIGEEDLEGTFVDGVPDDALPLYVCKVAFQPPAASEALLELEPGDLVRVTTLPGAHMLFGFLDGRREHCGWIPRNVVSLLEDPLSQEDTSGTARLTGLTLPRVPNFHGRS
mmetsp:Transcript_111909/g.316242  ORF Transcript_111909/g.316242 Transcript_111909/m.316242 type:complete len:384 (+) Transcript_111909:56-1207(+)